MDRWFETLGYGLSAENIIMKKEDANIAFKIRHGDLDDNAYVKSRFVVMQAITVGLWPALVVALFLILPAALYSLFVILLKHIFLSGLEFESAINAAIGAVTIGAVAILAVALSKYGSNYGRLRDRMVETYWGFLTRVLNLFSRYLKSPFISILFVLAISLAISVRSISYMRNYWDSDWWLGISIATLTVGILGITLTIYWISQEIRFFKRAKPVPILSEAADISVAHMSDLHFVATDDEWRLESGIEPELTLRRGNARLRALFKRFVNREKSPEVVFITGDLTDSGRRTEWLAFLRALRILRQEKKMIVAIPGNHDVNISDRFNPGRVDSPDGTFRLFRTLRMLKALAIIHRKNAVLIDDQGASRVDGGRPMTLQRFITKEISEDAKSLLSKPWCTRTRVKLQDKVDEVFPIFVLIDKKRNIGAILINSCAATHLSITNAFGYLGQRQLIKLRKFLKEHSNWSFFVLLHHDICLFEGIKSTRGDDAATVLANRGELLLILRKYRNRLVVLHGHRHIDANGEIAEIQVFSARSASLGGHDDSKKAGFRILNFEVGNGGGAFRFCSDELVV